MECFIVCEICGNKNYYKVVNKRLGLDEAGELSSVKCDCIEKITKSKSIFDIGHKGGRENTEGEEYHENKEDTNPTDGQDENDMVCFLDNLVRDTEIQWTNEPNKMFPRDKLPQKVHKDDNNADVFIPEYSIHLHDNPRYTVKGYDTDVMVRTETEREIRFDNKLSRAIENVLESVKRKSRNYLYTMDNHGYIANLSNIVHKYREPQEDYIEWISKCYMNVKIDHNTNVPYSFEDCDFIEPRVSGNVRIRVQQERKHSGLYTHKGDPLRVNEDCVKEGVCEAKISLSSTQIGPGASYFTSVEAELAKDSYPRVYSIMRSFSECRAEIEEGIMLVRRQYKTDRGRYVRYEVEFSNAKFDKTDVASIHRVYSKIIDVVGHCKISRFGMSHYIDNNTLRKLYTSCTHVKDIRSVNVQGYAYLVKPDGYCTWILRYGASYVVCMPINELRIIRVFPANVDIASGYVNNSETRDFEEMGSSGIGEIHRFESLICKVHKDNIDKFAFRPCGYVYIDTIMDKDCHVSVSRPYPDREDMERSITDLVPLSPCFSRSSVLRKQLNNSEDAENERNVVTYPTDGIVLINKNTSSTFRVKVPTIDAIFDYEYGTPTLYLKNSVRGKVEYVPICNIDSKLRVNGIYECTIDIAQSSKDRMRILTNKSGELMISHRRDKNTPNWYNIYKNIILAYRCRGSSISQIALIDIQYISFKIRKYLYDSILCNEKGGHLIVDVGTSKFQGIPCIDQDMGSSIIFCDPDLSEDIPTQYRDRIDDMTGLSEKDMLRTVDRFHRQKRKYGSYKGKIEDLMSMDSVRNYVIDNRIPLVYCFSAQHCVEFISEMSKHDAVQCGCLYVYEEESPYLVNMYRYGGDDEDSVISFVRHRIGDRDMVSVKIGASVFMDPFVTSETLSTYNIPAFSGMHDILNGNRTTQLVESLQVLELIKFFVMK